MTDEKLLAPARKDDQNPEDNKGQSGGNMALRGSVEHDLAELEPAAPRRRSRLFALKLTLGVILASVLICLASFAISFYGYVAMLNSKPTEAIRAADGIVVFTGGRERISKSLSLLAEGKAKRLLISGVHPDTTVEQISLMTEQKLALFRCCVDLDRKALNTIGNASETANWAHENGFASLVVVTSAYHMPRALAELQALLPEVELIPNSVFHEGLDLRNWYSDPATTKLLLREFVKYTLVRLRVFWYSLT
ncbi:MULTISPECIES: YdcF family protein [Pseudovibrio]|uniref:YdcF family protein n=1 Tax=Stappiaceae TaxID=2821832 RepID=UPI0023657779|nr:MULTISPECIES: YdcF family protein [Pseudovibrio]MDD7909475.1 YdcF family protein [Pseudovibrio exalbescens]MDX5595035.1 YdcF family protein [Pseudovibrio sp. SPO723]